MRLNELFDTPADIEFREDHVSGPLSPYDGAPNSEDVIVDTIFIEGEFRIDDKPYILDVAIYDNFFEYCAAMMLFENKDDMDKTKETLSSRGPIANVSFLKDYSYDRTGKDKRAARIFSIIINSLKKLKEEYEFNYICFEPADAGLKRLYRLFARRFGAKFIGEYKRVEIYQV